MNTNNNPLIFQHFSECTLIQNFINDEEIFHNSFFSSEKSINLDKDNNPIYCSLFKSPPTNCYTPGKYIPGGYTKSGTYKAARHTPSKTDKRAGK